MPSLTREEQKEMLMASVERISTLLSATIGLVFHQGNGNCITTRTSFNPKRPTLRALLGLG